MLKFSVFCNMASSVSETDVYTLKGKALCLLSHHNAQKGKATFVSLKFCFPLLLFNLINDSGPGVCLRIEFNLCNSGNVQNTRLPLMRIHVKFYVLPVNLMIS